MESANKQNPSLPAHLTAPLDEETESRIAAVIGKQMQKATFGKPRTVEDFRLIVRVYPDGGWQAVREYMPDRSANTIKHMASCIKVKMSKRGLKEARRRDNRKQTKARQAVRHIKPGSLEHLALCGRRVESFVGRREGWPV